MWTFAALAIVLPFSLPNHAYSLRLSRPGKLNRQKPLLAAKLSTPAEFLAARNKIREIHNLTLLAWDQRLAGHARWWADTRLDNCKKLLHSPNIALTEKTCSGLYGITGMHPSVCGHYTQIVWNATQRVGCAHVLCHNIQGHLFVFSYDPPGNIYYHGPFGGRFNKSIVNPPSSNNASSTILGSQSGITGNKANYIVSSTTGHPANKT
ncbi:hypothetical protein NC652_017457 [Populus alba x Populus x berolinensis]|uniref:SCP domain-containing protein n=2 Tax=Populus TaxID=3689 RepID=A0A4U5PVE6_POPAL|nr:hypothetical protein NC652_017457 [Populus alba x Populus x berolinensis]KAJ6994504.1 hypothetical protein NC653_017348 [Populus alba x Populus x berolinensis]TKR99594.1 hypothetical protein D5086_0000190240 [Populus alba]